MLHVRVDVWPVTNTQPPVLPVRFNHLPLGFLSLVILLDSKAQQTELEWISYPPNGVSLQNLRITCRHTDVTPLPPCLLVVHSLQIHLPQFSTTSYMCIT